MTFAPPTIKEVRAYLKGEDADLSDVELGIVGGPGHVRTGTSYHLGKDQLIMSKNPYSARTARDRAGLSNASSALDIDDDLDELRDMSVWIVAECRKGTPDTLDIREVIYSPDGVIVLQWDRERGVNSAPRPHPDLSHRGHSHFSWYRDSEFRDKTAIFKRYFATLQGGDMTAWYDQRILVRLPEGQDPTVWFGDGIHRRPVADPDELKRIQQAWPLPVQIVTELEPYGTPIEAVQIDPEVIQQAVAAALANMTYKVTPS